MDDEGWEAQMAARNRERFRAQPPSNRPTPAGHRADIARIRATMTLGDALERLRNPGPACACRGYPDCCMDTHAAAEALQQTAHVLVRLLVQVRPID